MIRQASILQSDKDVPQTIVVTIGGKRYSARNVEFYAVQFVENGSMNHLLLGRLKSNQALHQSRDLLVRLHR